MAMGLLSGGRAAQYSIELLAQWDRKRRPIPLAGDKLAKHFGKVVLIHLLEVSVTEQSTLCLIRDKRENLIGFAMLRQKGFSKPARPEYWH